MLYLSELLGKRVHIKGRHHQGKLSDLIFVTSDTPYITKIKVKFGNHKEALYPITSLAKIDGIIHLHETTDVALGENEAYVAMNVLDQQVIDIKGKNIVRVNDVIIQEKPTLTISGIDIGITGILRWLKVEDVINAFLPKPMPHNVLPWSEIQPLELVRGKIVLNLEENKLKSIEPEDLADYLEKTTIQNALKILSLVTNETASEVIENLNINYQTQIFRQMLPETAAQIITYADPDEACDLLLTVSEEKQKHILSLVSPEKKKELLYLLSHTETAIGELMTTEFLLFSAEDTVGKVMDRIKKESAQFDTLSYGYVVNKKDELIGVFSLHELLLQQQNTQLLKFMNQNVLVIYLTTPRLIAIRRMLKYKLRSIPVIDNHRHILGIVTFDDVVEPILEKMY